MSPTSSPPVLTRFDFERAFTDPVSALGPASRHLLHVLAMRLDKDRFVIRPPYQPSLTDLARDMGCNRRTAMRRLNRAEAAGWLVRDRPSLHDARIRHLRTQYTLCIPADILELLKAKGKIDPQLRAENPRAEGSKPPELGAPEPEAGGSMPRRSSESSGSSDSDLDAIITEIRNRTGRTIGRLGAARVRTELLDKASSTVRDPKAYLRTSIQREPDPSRWLPTPTPPPFRELDPRGGT
jgi:hypothetical protein